MISCTSAHGHAERQAKVWRLARTGNIANLKLEQDSIAPPRHGQATVAVKAVRSRSMLRAVADSMQGHSHKLAAATSCLMLGWGQLC